MIDLYNINVVEDRIIGDFEFEVTADSLNELFTGAGIATVKAMVDPTSIDDNKSWEIELKEQDLEFLLFDFLNEIIALKDSKTVLFRDFSVDISKSDEMYILKASLHGDNIDYDNKSLLTDVKAVTMHEFIVEIRAEMWYCHVILDL